MVSANATMAPSHPELEGLARRAGTWKVTMTMRPTADAEPLVVRGLVALQIIGFDPTFLDFSSPELAPLNLTAEKYFLLFEKLLNVVHELAPKARIGLNTKPTDTVEAVRRWL